MLEACKQPKQKKKASTSGITSYHQKGLGLDMSG
jgi:hypothetical protein